VINSRRWRWAGFVARIGEMRSAYNISVRKHGRITIEWILGKWGGKMWNGFIWLRIGTSGGIL
jgi:hypothetical protein